MSICPAARTYTCTRARMHASGTRDATGVTMGCADRAIGHPAASVLEGDAVGDVQHLRAAHPGGSERQIPESAKKGARQHNDASHDASKGSFCGGPLMTNAEVFGTLAALEKMWHKCQAASRLQD